MKSSIGLFVSMLCLAIGLPAALVAGDYRMTITAFGSFESARVPTSAALDFGKDVAIESLRFLNAEGEAEPFFFLPEPNAPGRGRLFWMWRQASPFLGIPYTVLVSGGEWTGEGFGDEALGARVMKMARLVGNHTFEDVADGAPVGWTLQGTAELSDAEAYIGTRSVKIISSADESGRLISEFVTLKPDTRYQLSFRVNITERRETEPSRQYHAQQGVAGQITLRNRDGGQPGANWRIWRFYTTRNRPEAQYLNRWITVSADGTTSSEIGSGRVEISPLGIDAVFHIDNVVLEELPSGQPHRLEIGELEGIQ